MRNQNHDKNPNWKGGFTTHTKGYRMVRGNGHPRTNPNGYVMEHILVAEKKIGRSLKDREVVHHVDNDKTNNHPDNLVVMSIGEHAHIHHGYKKQRQKKERIGYKWPADNELLAMSKSMSTRQIAESLGGISHVAVWHRIKNLGSRLTGKPRSCCLRFVGPNPTSPDLLEGT